jgi:hypothetical protein
MAELGGLVRGGELGEADAIARAPFPADTARTALSRSMVEAPASPVD